MTELSESQSSADTSSQVEQSQPWFFGAPGKELFCWVHGRRKDGPSRIGAVVCGTLGVESLSSHRQLRILAESLAEHGIPTVRFDYAGSGDSVDPPGTLDYATCIDNVRTAIRFAKTHCSIEHVVVVGLRLGSIFAVKAAELENVSGLVLWGPVVSGKRFAREWSMMAQRSESDGQAGNQTINANGFLLSRKFLDDLTASSLLQAEPRRPLSCLVVEREELSPEDKLVVRLKEIGVVTDRCRPGGFMAGMIAEPHLTEVPSAAIRTIREWIADIGRKQSDSRAEYMPPPVRITKTITLPDDQDAAGVRTRERFLDLNDTDGVFGIITEPVVPGDWNGQCIVLLNAGSAPHIGPNRMHVEFARRLASQGSRVCRADLRGIGDSPGVAGSRQNDPYPASAVDDVSRILRALTSSGGCSRIALAGLCSGAWASFHGALGLDGITDIVLINPDFYGERSVVGKPASFIRPKDYSHYKHSARSWAKWKKLLMGRANVGKIVRVLWNQTLLTLASFKLRMAGEHHQLDKDLARLAISRVRVGFIFSPGDGGADFLRVNGRLGVEQLRQAGLLREVTISDADHPFSLPGAKHRLSDTLSEWLR